MWCLFANYNKLLNEYNCCKKYDYQLNIEMKIIFLSTFTMPVWHTNLMNAFLKND